MFVLFKENKPTLFDIKNILYIEFSYFVTEYEVPVA